MSKIYTNILFLVVLLYGFQIHAQDSINKNAIKIFYIKLNEEIQPAAGRLIKNAFNKAVEKNADFILLEINTYGGRLDIADSIRSKVLYSKIPTIAFINNNAASAGALISLACDSIYMAPGASIGAATVVSGATGEQMPDKYQSYMRGMIRSTAETKGRSPDIAEAMVDERKVVEGISDSGKVLTLTSKEAVKYNMANGIAENIEEVMKNVGVNNYVIEDYKITSADKIINFLLNPLVNSLLIILIIGGIYFELKTPGIGLPILVSLIATLLYFAPLIIDGTAGLWEVLIFLVGMGLLLLEIFVIPGFGVTGIAGIICIIAGLTLGLVHVDGFHFNVVTGDLLARAFFRVTLIIFAMFGLIFFFGESLLTLPGFNKLVLTSDQEAEKGYSVKRLDLYNLIGKEAIVLNQLRPTGKVTIDDKIYEATSDAGLVEIGTRVRVIGVDSYSLRVTNRI
ncbi:MAG: hypothetical protein M9887_00040 [Chitinophagales bacterium]|nr:hypothetical protein [Chitinophagales bacterium]